MTRTNAVKMIYKLLNHGGLPKAIDIYNYISCYGEITITVEMINIYMGVEK